MPSCFCNSHHGKIEEITYASLEKHCYVIAVRNYSLVYIAITIEIATPFEFTDSIVLIASHLIVRYAFDDGAFNKICS